MKPSKLMSNMLALLPVGHKPCFFLRGAFLKRLPADVRAHLLRDDFSDPIFLALKADEIYQSRVSVYTVSSAPQESVNALDPQLPTGPAIQLLLMPAAARITGHYLLPCVTTIAPGVLRQRNAELCVPGWETSSPAGGCSYPTCRALYLVSFNLSTGFPEFKEISH